MAQSDEKNHSRLEFMSQSMNPTPLPNQVTPAALISIARSLERIADSLEKLSATEE